MRLNLKTKTEPKKQIAVMMYLSDVDTLQDMAKENGITLAMLVRSTLNDLIETHTTQEGEN